MARDKRLSRDQKRKKKLTERKKSQAAGPTVTAYEGDKYKAPRWVNVVAAVESAIHEADVISEERLTDREVRRSMESLVLSLRDRPPRPPTAEPPGGEAPPEDLVAALIRARWKEGMPEPIAAADLIGILRTLMGSLDVRTRMTPGGRGYLYFLSKFLPKVGVRTVRLTPEEEARLEVIVPDDEQKRLPDRTEGTETPPGP